jgi:photosystem II stability/assembly factor-like uncharacterized protein
MSDDLERRLADSLRGDRLPDAPDTLRAFLERLPAEADARPPERRSRLAWLAPTLVVVVVAAFVFALVPQSTSPPAGPSSPAASASAVQAIAWRKVASTGSGVLLDGDTVMSAIAFDGGYVMVGNAQNADHAAWWDSRDGTAWQRHDTDPVFADSLLQQIVRIPDGLLIVGSANRLDNQCAGGVFGCNPVMPLRMWTSPDGRTWQRVPDADLAVFGRGRLSDVVSGPAGVVAVGSVVPANGDAEGMIWTSPDGRTWEIASQFSATFPRTVPTNVVLTGGRYVVVGYRQAPDGSLASPAAWYSTDARAWRAAAGAETIGDTLLSSAGGALTVSIHPIEATLSRTADGSTWRADGAVFPFGFGDNGPTLLSDGSRILALGTRVTSAARGAWLSSDAQRWQELPETGGLPPLDRTGAVGTLGPGGVVLVTTTPSLAFTNSIWFGSFGAIPEATPEPSATPTASPSAGSALYLAGASRGGSLWAIRGSSWLVSTDAGASWQEHPLPVAATKVMTANAIDATRAWLVSIGAGSTDVTGAPTDVLRYVVWHTSDGGATWRSTTVPGNYAGDMPVLSFVDLRHGYLLAAEQRFSDGISRVLGTSDGGLTWSQVGSVPSLGSEFTASDASTLWAGAEQEAGPVVHPVFEMSRDGGRTWAEVALPGIAPHQMEGPMVYLPGPPAFLDSQSGAVAVTIESPDAPHTRIYRTTDGGATWTLAADQPVEASGGPALADEAHWFLPVDNPLALLSSTDAGASWQQVATNGLGWVIWIGALDGGDLAALVPAGNSYPGSALLFVSSDGGHTWQPRL